MTYLDHVVTQDAIRFKRSSEAGEVPQQHSLRPGELAVNTADGVVFVGRNSGAATPVSGGEGGSYDQSLNTTDAVTFDSVSLPNGTQVTVGSFDNMTGGASGISLHCAVGYELNWQGGRLRSVMLGDEEAEPQPIHCDSPMQFHGGVVPRVTVLAGSGEVATNASAGEIFDIELTDNITLANPSNPVNGQTLRWRLTQDGTGSRSVTLGDKFNLPASATSPLPFSTAAGKMDVLAATYHAGREKWDVIAFVPGY